MKRIQHKRTPGGRFYLVEWSENGIPTKHYPRKYRSPYDCDHCADTGQIRDGDLINPDDPWSTRKPVTCPHCNT